MKSITLSIKMIAAITVMIGLLSQSTQAQQVQVSVTNNAPANGIALTPFWFGFHDGTFDTFNIGSAVTAGLESLAEDGAVGTLSAEFNAAAVGGVDSNIGGGNALPFLGAGGPRPILGGESTSAVFNVGSNNFLSYASMVLISNDFFVGNDSALDISSVLAGGGPITINVGSVYDAGTEDNDFATSAANGAPFFGLGGGQSGPNEGATENGVVTLVSPTGDPFAGFANSALLGPDGVPATFNFNDPAQYTSGIATITISAVAVPEPGSLTLLAAFAGCGILRRRRK